MDNINFKETELFYRAAWQCLSSSGSAHLASILRSFPSAEIAWKVPQKEFQSKSCFSGVAWNNILQSWQKNKEYPEKLFLECQRKNIKLCSVEDEIYPELLREIYNPPQILFYRGILQGNRKRVAMVGSRNITPYGKVVAERIATDLAKAGISIVSGGAIGVDAYSHKAALSVGFTEAILGSGIDYLYPPSNRGLLEDIAEKGVLISEYAPGAPPNKNFFPARNRIISGMSRATIVVEAAQKSGSLITAEMALSDGRDVFAVPGSIYADTSVGCNNLIRQGAGLITSAKDIFAAYPDWNRGEEKKKYREGKTMEISEEENQVLGILTLDNPLSIDEIIYKLHGQDSTVSNIAFTLLQMELKGMVCRNACGAYTRSLKGRFI